MSSSNTPKVMILDPTLIAERDYWIKRLVKRAKLSSVWPNHPRPDVYSDDKNSIEFNLAGDLYHKLCKLTDDSSFLWYTIILAAVSICLRKYSGQLSIIIGSPARIQDSDSNQPSNAVAILNEVDDSLSLRQFLLNVRQSLLDAYSHQNYPFDLLIKDLGLKILSDCCPLFDIAIQFDQLHTPLPELRNDITIRLRRKPDRLNLTILYNNSLYEEESIQRLAIHIQNVLRTLASDTNLSLREIQLLDQEEREQVLKKWNQARSSHEFAFIHKLIGEQAKTRPEAIAIEFEEEKISYGQLEARTNQMANYLVARGVGREHLVGICMSRSIALVEVLLAVLKSGGGYVPLEAGYPAVRLRHVIEQSNLKLILTDEANRDQLRGIVSGL